MDTPSFADDTEIPEQLGMRFRTEASRVATHDFPNQDVTSKEDEASKRAKNQKRKECRKLASPLSPVEVVGFPYFLDRFPWWVVPVGEAGGWVVPRLWWECRICLATTAQYLLPANS